MAAAEITETLVKGNITDGGIPYIPGQGMKMATYTATVATQNDWIIFEDFSEVQGVYAEIVASGVLNPCTVDGTTKNKVVLTLATTGAVRILVWGI